MAKVLVPLATILSMISGFALLVNAWINSEDKELLREDIKVKYCNLSSGNAITVILYPLTILKLVLDAILGEKIISRKAIVRSAYTGILIMICSLGIAGVLVGTPLAIHKTPWAAYDDEINLQIKLLETDQTIAASKYLHAFNKAREWYWKWIYSAILVLLVSAISIIGNVLSLATTRRILKDLLATDSAILISGAFVLLVLTTSILASIIVILISCISNPLIILATYIATFFSGHHAGITSLLWILNVGIAWWASEVWVRAVAVSSLLPSIILLIITFLSLLLFSVRFRLHQLITSLLDKALTYEQGFIAFVAAVSGGLAAILTGLIIISQALG